MKFKITKLPKIQEYLKSKIEKLENHETKYKSIRKFANSFNKAIPIILMNIIMMSFIKVLDTKYLYAMSDVFIMVVSIWITLLMFPFILYILSDSLIGKVVSKNTFISLCKPVLFIIFFISEIYLIKSTINTGFIISLMLLLNIISLALITHMVSIGKNNEYHKFLFSFFISTLTSIIGAAGSIISSFISK